MTTTAVIVQARMGSTRLPGKVMADLAGKPVLEHVLRRCDRIPGIDVVVCAIPDTVADASLMYAEPDVVWYRGPERDVLARYLGAAAAVKADIIVRVTADCPMIDPEICGEVIMLRKEKGVDYASNVHPRSFPQGLDCEVFKASTLAKLSETSERAREHVTTQLAEAPRIERASYRRGTDLSHHRWTLDYPEDLEFMRAVFAVREPHRMQDVLDVLREHPEIEKINACRKAA